VRDAGQKDLTGMLRELEALSDEEAQQLLGGESVSRRIGGRYA
jgi:hypothetical protein